MRGHSGVTLYGPCRLRVNDDEYHHVHYHHITRIITLLIIINVRLEILVPISFGVLFCATCCFLSFLKKIVLYFWAMGWDK